MAKGLLGLLQVILPKKKPPSGGDFFTPTYNPFQKDLFLTLPSFTTFRNDIFTDRQTSDSQTLLKTLFRNDPDVSAAVNGYLTLANTEMVAWAEGPDGMVDPVATATLHLLIKRLSRQVDYTQGYQFKQNIRQIAADLRYMLLLRGAIALELILDKQQVPDNMRVIDPKSIRMFEHDPGVYKPGQVVIGQPLPTPIDSPTFVMSYYRRDPTSIYGDSPFVASINTIAARQQVINDLYRIMRVTGYPRLDIKVMEEVLINRAPPAIRSNTADLRAYVASEIATLQATFADIRPDQAVVHTDSVEFSVMNARSPGMAMDVTSVIETLNAQNQAALKTMSTVLGRGASGANTGSVEARLAAMYADELNEPVADALEKLLTLALQMQGVQAFANISFRPAELRPETELEPQRLTKATRLRQDLSDGIISDAEYTLEMYNRLPLPGAPLLSGTGFINPAAGGGVNPADISPNSDPLGRSISPETSKINKANQPKSAPPAGAKK